MKKRLPYKVISASAVCALLVSSFGISASAAVIDEDVIIPAPKAVLLESKGGEKLGAFDLPSSFSSVDLGYVSSVKTQLYNDCWVYGGLGTVESLLLKNGIETEELSVNHVNIWGTTRNGNKGWIRSYEDAGRSKTMPGYLISWQGAVAQSKTPELFPGGIVTADNLPTDLADYGITSIKYLFKEDPDSIKRAVMESGGVSTYYSHSANCVSSDDKSIYMPPDYTGSYNGHAVELVGWDDNYSADNFKQRPKNDGAWLIKGSWGKKRGDNGFFWISYEDRDIFNSTKYRPTYQLKSFEEITDNKKLMQNEIYGATWEFDYVDTTNLTIFESFDFESDYRMIDKVIFESVLQGASYNIYYVPDKNGVPDNDETKWTELYSSVIEFPGYICADIKDFKAPGQSGNIAVRIDSSSLGQKASAGVCEWLSSNGSNIFVNDSKPDQSYILYNGLVMDTLDYYKNFQDDDIGGTFVIKAVTKKAYKPGDVNLDGKIDIFDSTDIQKFTVEKIDFTDEQSALADLNKDGDINVIDALIIQKYLVGKCDIPE